MDLSYAEDDEAELQAAEQHMGVRSCFICRSTSHLRSQCPARQPRPTPPHRRSASGTTGCGGDTITVCLATGTHVTALHEGHTKWSEPRDVGINIVSY